MKTLQEIACKAVLNEAQIRKIEEMILGHGRYTQTAVREELNWFCAGLVMNDFYFKTTPGRNDRQAHRGPDGRRDHGHGQAGEDRQDRFLDRARERGHLSRRRQPLPGPGDRAPDRGEIPDLPLQYLPDARARRRASNTSGCIWSTGRSSPQRPSAPGETRHPQNRPTRCSSPRSPKKRSSRFQKLSASTKAGRAR